ncbi:MAG: hypothetical protein E7012_03295 [Alphaproteobacteria bacterium]|nr:hypothetical protein [Alphaproteobacteria bacterium]
MSKIYNIGVICLTLLISACQNQLKPAIVPPPSIPDSPTLGLAVIGGVEPFYLLPMKTPFAARIDTGAETSSIDVENLTPFERDGEKWVSFTMINKQNGETYTFEKRVIRKTRIRRINKDEHRYVVKMDIKIGNEITNAEFSLADREKFDYQGLIGRNVINGRFLIDASLDNTLH